MKTIKTTFILACALLATIQISMAQPKASPAKSASADVNGNKITINYCSPAVKGRTIWGELVPYDKVWRTGANDATTLEVSKDCKINGQDLKAGKYALFTVPGKDKWKVIINSVSKQWGAYNYDASKDVASFEVTPKSADMSERMTFTIADNGTVSLNWDKLQVDFKVK